MITEFKEFTDKSAVYLKALSDSLEPFVNYVGRNVHAVANPINVKLSDEEMAEFCKLATLLQNLLGKLFAQASDIRRVDHVMSLRKEFKKTSGRPKVASETESLAHLLSQLSQEDLAKLHEDMTNASK